MVTMELSASEWRPSQRNGKQHGIQHDAAGQRGGTDQRDSENQAAEDRNTDRQLFFTELVQADLKRSLLLLGAFEEGGDLTISVSMPVAVTRKEPRP